MRLRVQVPFLAYLALASHIPPRSYLFCFHCLALIVPPSHDALGKSWLRRTPAAKEMATIVIPRRRRPAGQAFYTTALVVTLFAVYSVLRDVGDSKDAARQSARLALRSLEKRDGDVRLRLSTSSEATYILTLCSVDLSTIRTKVAHTFEPIAPMKKPVSYHTCNYIIAP